MYIIDVSTALVVRLVLLVHSLLVVWLVTSMKADQRYWLLVIVNIGMVAEALVTVGKNKAKEWKWFCPCFFFYLCSTIPGIWILELNRMYKFQDLNNQLAAITNNDTSVFEPDESSQHVIDAAIQGLGISGPKLQIETDTLTVIMEQLFLYLMILARWILPRGEITRDELSQLMFVFIGIASDITELFALFEEDKVRQNTQLTYAILCIWTISLFQFTFVLTSTHNPKKSSGAGAAVSSPVPEPEESCVKSVFQTEVWSICVNFLLQDGPFLAVRLYTMIGLNVLTYSIIFFTAKNALLVMLMIYRLTVVCCERKGKVDIADDEDTDVIADRKLNNEIANA